MFKESVTQEKATAAAEALQEVEGQLVTVFFEKTFSNVPHRPR
eukprot:CAMPEP_0179193588 /NCGR_PEP_ID=MMETSP0796-20121207/96204_1 /TAXON_ID=73915 /ORGANISM="Pyrodinium bahamense, Strain pbaha01" /LENGTH=42 /DNA_ID= /DNA_START= /DNA_END= /DNA_ORIENTATION=